MKKFIIILVTAMLFVSLSAQSIAGVSFGSSYESAKTALTNKWGEPSFIDKNCIGFEKVTYANHTFDNVYFDFQRDNNGKSYMNRCVFIKEAKDRNDAVNTMRHFSSVFSEKYGFIRQTGQDDEDFILRGGKSPLGDGNYLFTIDYINYPSGGYAARIDYGPFEYVKEEF